MQQTLRRKIWKAPTFTKGHRKQSPEALTKGEQRGRRKTARVCPRSQSKLKIKVLGQTPGISSQLSPEALNPGFDI